jgi:tRNA(Ile)-lysidine synthase
LRDQGQSWREDSSNRDLAFLRNRVRHRLLPIIGAEFGEAAIEHMGELAEIARAEEEHWERGHPEIAQQLADAAKQTTAGGGFESGYRCNASLSSLKEDTPLKDGLTPSASLSVVLLLALPLGARRRLMRAWLETNATNLSVSFRLIEQALELAGASGESGPTENVSANGRIEMPSGWNLRRARQVLLLEDGGAVDVNHARHRDGDRGYVDYEYALAVPGSVHVPELGVRIEASVVDAASVPEEQRGQLLNVGLMPAEVVIRNWRAGDRYCPAHTSAEKKVKELLTGRRVTGARKKLWPVAAVAGCGLIWLRNFAVPAAYGAPAGASKAIWIREIVDMM